MTSLGRRERTEDRQLRFDTEVSASSDGKSIPLLRVIGQLGATYIVAEGPQGMVLLDQHAAHERVLFEQLLAQREEADVASQALLEPTLVELGREAADLLEEQAEALARLGFEFEPFGGSTLMVRALPTVIAEEEPGRVLEDVAAALLAGDEPLDVSVEETVARQVCRQTAVKAGQVLDHAEMEGLIRALEQCESPRTCPHGRPTMIRLSVEHLAREFGRT
jgi:DNA mismatch repair protein MutL